MVEVSFGDVIEGRSYISGFLLNKKTVSNFTVIDIGGTASGWSSNIADAFIDINHQDTNKLQFNFDICKEKNWKPVLEFVEKNGKFDFSICTHTLEDIYNPYLVLDILPKISKQGVITTPSILSELNFVETTLWSGYIHHRYLFGFKDNKIIIAPKLPIVESIKDKIEVKDLEIRYEWVEDIPYTVFMDNYLGPNKDILLDEYGKFIIEQKTFL